MAKNEDRVRVYGSLLKQARKRAGKTQEEAATVLNCHTRTIRNYETESTDVPPMQLLRLCEFYGAKFDELTRPTSNDFISELEQLEKEYGSMDGDGEPSDDSLDDFFNEMNAEILRTNSLIGMISDFFLDCNISLKQKRKLAMETHKMLIILMKDNQEES